MGDVVRQTEFTGARFGLKLVLNVNTAEYVGILSPSEGIRVSIHNPYEVSFPESNVSRLKHISRLKHMLCIRYAAYRISYDIPIAYRL